MAGESLKSGRFEIDSGFDVRTAIWAGARDRKADERIRFRKRIGGALRISGQDLTRYSQCCEDDLNCRFAPRRPLRVPGSKIITRGQP